MLYNINVNQKAAVENFPGLNWVELAIFQCMKNMVLSDSERLTKQIFNSQQYTWISYSKIIEEMPLIQISNTQVIARHVKALVTAGLLNRQEDLESRTYFNIGPRAHLLEFSGPGGTDSKVDGVDSKVDPVLKSQGTVDFRVQQGLTLKSNNNNTIMADNNTIDNNHNGTAAKHFLDWYVKEYLSRFKVKYHVNGAKDMTILKRLTKTMTVPELEKLAIKFFESDDKFITSTGYTIGVFYSQINKLKLTGKAGKMSLLERERSQPYVVTKKPLQ